MWMVALLLRQSAAFPFQTFQTMKNDIEKNTKYLVTNAKNRLSARKRKHSDLDKALESGGVDEKMNGVNARTNGDRDADKNDARERKKSREIGSKMKNGDENVRMSEKKDVAYGHTSADHHA